MNTKDPNNDSDTDTRALSKHNLTKLSQGARSSSICGPPSANKQVKKGLEVKQD